MIRLALKGGSVEVPLTGHFSGLTLTLRRLPSNEFATAQRKALSWLRDKGKVAAFIERHDMLPPDAPGLIKIQADANFMGGLGVLFASIECGVRAIEAWSGLLGADNQPIEIEKGSLELPEQADDPIPTARLALETLFLDEHFQRQADHHIGELARIVVVEGKPSGGAPNGTSADVTTVSPPTTAETAESATIPAQMDVAAPTESSARKSSTRRRPKKAPPSGD